MGDTGESAEMLDGESTVGDEKGGDEEGGDEEGKEGWDCDWDIGELD